MIEEEKKRIDNETVTVKMSIYDMEFDMTIDKNRIEEYSLAAKEVTNRLNAYTVFYRDRKTEHKIALMTMIDLAVYPFLNQSDNDEQKKEIELSVCDETIKVTIKERDQDLFERSAKRVTNCYNRYLGYYKDYKTEDAIERMTLLDICLHRMEWKHKRFLDYFISE